MASYRMRRALAIALVAAMLVVAGCMDLGVPQWSTDGRRIVYTRLADLKTPEVWLVDLDRPDSPQKIVSGALRPRWSPDGSRVYYLALTATGEGTSRAVLRSCDTTGAEVKDHAPGSVGDVSWYGIAASGAKLFYLRSDSHELFSLDLTKGRAQRIVGGGTPCRGAAIDTYGRHLAVAIDGKNRRGSATTVIRVFDLGFNPSDKDYVTGIPVEVDGGRVTLVFRPNMREVVAFRNPAKLVEVVPLDGGAPRRYKTETVGDVVFASCSPDGAALHVTTVIEGEGVHFTAEALDLDGGATRLIHNRATTLVGGRGWGAGGGAYAELTPLGLLVAAVDGRWERYYPAEPNEYRQTAEVLLARGEPAEAIDLLERVLEEAQPGDDVLALHLLVSDAHLAMERPDEAADALLAGYLLSPVSDVGGDELVRRVTRLRGHDPLLGKIARALVEKPSARARMLFGAMSMVAEPRHLAGLSFRAGEAALAAKDYRTAARHFRLASETTEFTAADYAIALAAGCHYVDGRNDKYAEELLLKAVDQFPTSPLHDDMRAALARVRDPAGAVLRRTSEAGTRDGFAAWVTVRMVRSMQWGVSASHVDVDGTRRRFVLRADLRSSLVLAAPGQRGEAVLADLPVELGELSFSPDGQFLAFLVKGSVPGWEAGAWADAYVIDKSGHLTVGDPGPLFTDGVTGTAAISGVTWTDGGRSLELRLVEGDGSPGGVRRVEVIKAERGGGALPVLRRPADARR